MHKTDDTLKRLIKAKRYGLRRDPDGKKYHYELWDRLTGQRVGTVYSLRVGGKRIVIG